MKKLLFIFAVIPFFAIAQGSKVFDNLSLRSKILNMERKYAIYLPPDYETSQRSYPVLYLLHGSGDDQTGWIQFGEVQYIADQSFIKGLATQMIIVMPDANTTKKGYFNDPKNEWRYEDFFFQEFMPFIEKNYRTKNEKRFRAISGLSMGGGGAFIYALHHPELFASSCPLSASVGSLNIEEATKYLLKSDSSLDNNTINNYFNINSVLQQINTISDQQKKAVRWYIDCGDDDRLGEGNMLVHIAMTKKDIPHEFRIRDGGHTWTYWRASLPKVLEFISMSFHQY
ncbi:MAG: esterase family protein [Chitinophagaceae bacterium]|jgi:enterochelin esterase-like enzyme|nr:esterase family protein [Chitinophagaceae bacterium]